MAKRRTKRQKQTAKHQFTLSKQRLEKLASTEGNVKGQFDSEAKTYKSKSSKIKNAKDTAKPTYLTVIRRDSAKSLLIASLILGLEVVIYFALR